MQNELYEKIYKNPKHFSFGKNWKNFLKHLNNKRIEKAENSLIVFLNGKENIVGKTFIDVGCGSGLFSLVAYRLGAGKVVSIDIDDASVACAKYLREKVGKPEQWEIKTGSVLNKNFLNSLDTFDIVYSWGVLHHTGNMYQAIENITHLVHSMGKLYIAIYNDNRKKLEGTSSFWLKAKRRYNKSGKVVKMIIEIIYTAYYIIGLMANWKNPIIYIKNYHSFRGMNFMSDIKDWLGGYPYEYASIEKIISFLDTLGFACSKYTTARSIGCNEFLFTKKQSS